MDLFLKDRAAIVGGASQGIGYGIARMLAAEGARVAITARREPELSRAAQQIGEETGMAVLAIPADCRRAEDCERVIERATKAFGGLDILVNNDGAPPLGELAGFDDAAWAKAVEQNLMYVVRMVRALRCDSQHHGNFGDPADPRLRSLGRHLGRSDRLCQDAVARGCARQHQRQHHLPRLHRNAAT